MNNLLSYQIQEYIEKYLKIQRDASLNTISTYSYGLLQFINFLKKSKIDIITFKVENINYDLTLKYIEYLKEKNNSARTINNRITILKSFLEYVSYKVPSTVENNRQIKAVKKIKEETKIHEYFTQEELRLILLEAKENIKYLCMLSILYDCALRVNELCNLKRNDLLLENNNPNLTVEQGKGKRSRIIPLSKENVLIIKHYLSVCRNENKDEYLFINKYNNKYSLKGVQYILKKYFEKAKDNCNDLTMFRIKPHCHMMRHSKGVHLVDANVPLTVIKDLLGHKNIQTTEIYARISTKAKRAILENNSINKEIGVKRTKKEKDELELFLKNNGKIIM